MSWKPYRPEGYPIQDDFHNPWMPIDVSGATAYDVWRGMGCPTDEETFQEELDRVRGVATLASACVNIGHDEISCQAARLPRSQWCEPCSKLGAEL